MQRPLLALVHTLGLPSSQPSSGSGGNGGGSGERTHSPSATSMSTFLSGRYTCWMLPSMRESAIGLDISTMCVSVLGAEHLCSTSAPAFRSHWKLGLTHRRHSFVLASGGARLCTRRHRSQLKGSDLYRGAAALVPWSRRELDAKSWTFPDVLYE